MYELIYYICIPWLTSFYQKILYSDIVIRNNVRNEQSLRLLMRKLADRMLTSPLHSVTSAIPFRKERVSRNTTFTTMVFLICSYSIRDEQTRNREVNALVSLSRYMKIDTALIITKDQEETIEEGGINIKVIPIWKWLLV